MSAVEPPVIHINGDNPAIIHVGDTYSDLGATITGPTADLNLGIHTFVNGIATSPVEIDTTQAATDTIDYVVTDQSGLTATSTRTVIVEPAQPSSQAATSTSDTLTHDHSVILGRTSNQHCSNLNRSIMLSWAPAFGAGLSYTEPPSPSQPKPHAAFPPSGIDPWRGRALPHDVITRHDLPRGAV